VSTDEAGGQKSTGPDADPDRRSSPGLPGRWRKVAQDPGAPAYPDEIEFSQNGLYEGTRGPESKGFTIWDLGTYKVLAPGRVEISTATDRMVQYACEIEADSVTFVSPEGHRVTYQREK